MKKKGIIVQVVGLLIMGVGIGLQLAKTEMYYLFVTFLGLFVVMAGLFIITAAKKKEDAIKDNNK
ncbi:hypothetical protein H0I23_08180 [Cellulophaga sp. HaHaR_3_176]|uniref:hypothetical protein n=1 Tax=Cellulophaga sp. HaHaR_3_176 TaxID=1942464 RepID=UPI001C1FCD6E|nr:hypothetical protein [Cellulophaga sp. HaHaR_3_176]QWX85604.1 hypothetical protein H0I23_08180 [Cellulophaga sp. HaHaR_3_176]